MATVPGTESAARRLPGESGKRPGCRCSTGPGSSRCLFQGLGRPAWPRAPTRRAGRGGRWLTAAGGGARGRWCGSSRDSASAPRCALRCRGKSRGVCGSGLSVGPRRRVVGRSVPEVEGGEPEPRAAAASCAGSSRVTAGCEQLCAGAMEPRPCCSHTALRLLGLHDRAVPQVYVRYLNSGGKYV